jgi:hypothetical protein
MLFEFTVDDIWVKFVSLSYIPTSRETRLEG